MKTSQDNKNLAVEGQLIADSTAIIQNNDKPVLMPVEFRALIRHLLSRNITSKKLEKTLEQAGVIERRSLRSDEYGDLLRIAVPSLNPSVYHYAVSIRRGAYLCHASAVHLLGLTQQRPKTIYVNKEQSPKTKPQGEITQQSIDKAFAQQQRHSNYVFRIDGFQIVLVSGKATKRAGVIDDEKTGLPLTGLERTLIDIAVRPRYSGGVFQVAQAFKEAINDIDIDKLVGLLRTLDYRYPYHQSIGFYLERAGAPRKFLEPLQQLGTEFDFYLDYAMASPSYDESWRVFFPLGV